MSIDVMSWVLRHSEETLGSRLVLLALADRASDDGTGAWPSVDTLARDARISRRSVQRCLRELEASGAIATTGTRDNGARIYRVNMSPPRGVILDVEGATSSTAGGDTVSPEPSLLQPSKDNHPTPSVGSPTPDGWQVNRIPVTEGQANLARDVLFRWNEAAEQDLTARDWLAKIVLRIREHPELTLDEHDEIICAALNDPWWKGPASPSVVYGNATVFDQARLRWRAGSGPSAVDIAQAGIDAARRAS